MKIYSKKSREKKSPTPENWPFPTTLPTADDLEDIDSADLIDHYWFEMVDDEDWTTP